ncbi:MAG: alpha-amylase family glycosyl hydrolase [Betaproteobacteria bacterium]
MSPQSAQPGRAPSRVPPRHRPVGRFASWALTRAARVGCSLAVLIAPLLVGALDAAGQTAASPRAAADRYTQREQDWRNGAVVYQVLVDRFAPSANLPAKRHLYAPPKTLRGWDEEPKPGHFVESAQVWSHEIDFWGGDLQSLRSRLDHVQGLGATVLYLNPIHLGYTNHKYDSLDFKAVSPEFGTREDVKALARDLHARGMKLVLDGVFNHMGRKAPRFLEAQRNPTSEAAQWFAFGPQYAGGARTWKEVQNLPELNLEHRPVRQHLWLAPDSVVRGYLRDGVDGWRLDTAYELGTTYLSEHTKAAHAEKPGSLVVGEIVNHPSGWMPAMDAVMNFHWRTLLLKLLKGEVTPTQAGRLIERTVQDVGIEPLLKSWMLLDNHDVPRVATAIAHEGRRRLAQTLQFTLPGSPNLYYGAEVGMTGGGDPAQRGPMRWDWVQPDHPELRWTRKLIQLRRSHRALRVGDFRLLDTQHLLAFERHTNRVADTVLVLANPSDQAVTETVALRNGMLMDDAPLQDALLAHEAHPQAAHRPEPLKVGAGFLTVTIAPWGVRVLTPLVPDPAKGYSVYKRIP